MISITFFRSPEGFFKGFKVFGHADSVDEGADLVCCSVSVLTINLLNSLEVFTPDWDSVQVIEDEESGLIDVVFDCPLSEQADLLMRSYELGVHFIANEYDPWLKVIMKEVQ